jgi:hypothetical protein
MRQDGMTPSEAVTVWSGWDVRGGAKAAEAFAAPFPRQSDAEEDFELLAVAARGFRPPRFLSAADLPGPDQHDDGDESREGLRMVWSLLYHRVAETGPALVAPYAVYLLGVNPPDDATEADLAIFNDFYTNVHMPEVADRRHALRAVRYELLREIRSPYQGAPRFLAVYELDEAGSSNRKHIGPPYTSGPEVWQRHTTPWRLWYRRLPAESGAP